MTRRPDAERILAARRAAAIASLVSSGELPERAAARIATWEAERAVPPDRAAWESLSPGVSGRGRDVSVRKAADQPARDARHEV
jgi:hypothetical protein